MLQKLRNRKGEVAAVVVAGIIGVGFVTTLFNGVAKKNAKTIWCKMQNKGNDYCDWLNKE